MSQRLGLESLFWYLLLACINLTVDLRLDLKDLRLDLRLSRNDLRRDLTLAPKDLRLA